MKLLIAFLISACSFFTEVRAGTLGAMASNLSGYGFYYQWKPEDDSLYTIKFIGLTFYYDLQGEDFSDRNFNIDFGFELQKDIKSLDQIRLYSLLGGYYYYDDDYENYNKEIHRKTNSRSLGFGLGLEYSQNKMKYFINWGYKYFDDRGSVSENGDAGLKEIEKQFKPALGAGVGFIF
jgi:hypothetical protein